MNEKDTRWAYIQAQFKRLALCGQHHYSIQLRDEVGNHTNWLNLTPAQLESVEHVLVGEYQAPFNPTGAKPGDGQPAPADAFVAVGKDGEGLEYVPVPAALELRQRLIDLAEGARSKASLLASSSPTSAYTNPVTVLRALAKEAEDGLVEGAPRARLDERLSAITREAQEAGYAITWWAPDSLEGIDVEALLDVAVQRGNEYISDNGPDPEALEKAGLLKVIEHLVVNGWSLSYVDNGEGAVYPKSRSEAVEAAAAVDEATVHFIKNEGTPARATGCLMLVWGNSPIELIADYGYKEGNGFDVAVEAALRSVWPNYPGED